MMSISALIVAATLLMAADAQEATKGAPPQEAAAAAAKKVKELRQERVATLKTAMELSLKLFTVGHFEMRDVPDLRMALLKAEVDAAENEADRIALYQEALESLKGYAGLAKAAKEAARGTELDIVMIKAKVLEVEIWLEQAKAEAAK